jgi:hypothetical protein
MVFVTATWNAFKRPRNTHTAMMKQLYRDGFSYFFVRFTCFTNQPDCSILCRHSSVGCQLIKERDNNSERQLPVLRIINLTIASASPVRTPKFPNPKSRLSWIWIPSCHYNYLLYCPYFMFWIHEWTMISLTVLSQFHLGCIKHYSHPTDPQLLSTDCQSCQLSACWWHASIRGKFWWWWAPDEVKRILWTHAHIQGNNRIRRIVLYHVLTCTCMYLNTHCHSANLFILLSPCGL